MARRPRRILPGVPHHVLNRAIRRERIFDEPADYDAFEALLGQATQAFAIRLHAYQLMPNHWHFLVASDTPDAVSRFIHWLCTTHTVRWHRHRGTRGTGTLYQDRFKSFPIQDGEHLARVWRYVERNALRARLVTRSEAWAWGSLYQRTAHGPLRDQLAGWPGIAADSRAWIRSVNDPDPDDVLRAIRGALQHDRPYGTTAWTNATVRVLGPGHSLRGPGRPAKFE